MRSNEQRTKQTRTDSQLAITLSAFNANAVKYFACKTLCFAEESL